MIKLLIVLFLQDYYEEENDPGDEQPGGGLENPETPMFVETWIILLLIFTFVWLWKYQQSKARSID